MVFSEATKREAFERANGCCEICGKRLVFENRGRNGGRGSWEAHHKKPRAEGGSDSVRNCMILCYQCHQQPQRILLVKDKSSPQKTTSDNKKQNAIDDFNNLMWGKPGSGGGLW